MVAFSDGKAFKSGKSLRQGQPLPGLRINYGTKESSQPAVSHCPLLPAMELILEEAAQLRGPFSDCKAKFDSHGASWTTSGSPCCRAQATELATLRLIKVRGSLPIHYSSDLTMNRHFSESPLNPLVSVRSQVRKHASRLNKEMLVE